jgi:hypothetical protein
MTWIPDAHTSATCDQVKDSLPNLRRITPAPHTVLLVGQQHGSPVIRPHKTQGSPPEVSSICRTFARSMAVKTVSAT